jgi:hypothetical protein
MPEKFYSSTMGHDHYMWGYLHKNMLNTQQKLNMIADQ